MIDTTLLAIGRRAGEPAEPGRDNVTRLVALPALSEHGAEGTDASSHPPHNLPARPTALVDRTGEVALVCHLLCDGGVRLLTLTGPGGVGKTRLAIAVAEATAAWFPDGAWFVDLSPLSDPAMVLMAIARALGVPEDGNHPLRERLWRHLHDRALLLVLDNVEQLLPDAALVVGELLEACPDLAIVATSREPLHLRRERRLPVRPLALPDLGRPLDRDEAARSPAVALFVERAQAVDPTFALRDDNAHAVAELCARLDGLPLAIELAAARLDLLPVAAMLKRADHSLALLSSGAVDGPVRHQTLRDLIGWSYDRLEEPERAVFRRLAVFSGGWTLEAAEAVCGFGGGVPLIELLSMLVDKSLVQVIEPEPDGEPRFRLLDMVREFAAEQLAANGESEDARHRHAAYVLDQAVQGRGDDASEEPGARSAAGPLSERERAVLCLVAEGLPSKQIGRQLAIGERTVKAHVTGAMNKLGAFTRAQAVAIATQRGLLDQ